MSKDIKTATAALVDPATALPNRYSADAAARMTALRAMSADFPHVTDPTPLTKSETAIVGRTTVTAIEKSAVFAESAPHVNGGIVDVDEARDAVAFELAYGGLADEGVAFFRRVKRAISRRKLEPAKRARKLYQVAKAHAPSDATIQSHVADLKRTLGNGGHRKKATPPEDAAAKT
jgi:hypothetical protein